MQECKQEVTIVVFLVKLVENLPNLSSRILLTIFILTDIQNDKKTRMVSVKVDPSQFYPETDKFRRPLMLKCIL